MPDDQCTASPQPEATPDANFPPFVWAYAQQGLTAHLWQRQDVCDEIQMAWVLYAVNAAGCPLSPDAEELAATYQARFTEVAE